MNPTKTLISALSLITLSTFTHAEMTVTSTDIAAGKHMAKAQEFQGFGCDGDNQSPQLSWSNAPSNTKSFAVTAYDPDAPTGSGWWHWQVVNIPATTTSLASGAGSAKEKLPEGSQTFRSDYGSYSFGGACPPTGDKAHRYQFKVFALDVEKLELPADGSAALVGYYLNSHAIEVATLEAFYKR